MRLELHGAYEGHWIDLDPAVPLVLYEAAQEGDEQAFGEFVARAVLAWSLAAVPPRQAPASLDSLPWDWWPLVLLAVREAGRLTDDEADDILQRVGVGQSSVRIAELDRFHLCQRLGMPFRASYEDLRAIEILRLSEALSIEDETREDLTKGR